MYINPNNSSNSTATKQSGKGGDITKAFILVRYYSVSTGGKSNQTKLRQKELYGGFIISCNGKLQI